MGNNYTFEYVIATATKNNLYLIVSHHGLLSTLPANPKNEWIHPSQSKYLAQVIRSPFTGTRRPYLDHDYE